MAKKKQLHYLIRGYRSAEKILERKVKAGIFSESQLKTMLMVLAGQHLTHDEIVGACAKKKTTISNDLLRVHRESQFFMLTCGHGTYFTVELAERKELKARLTALP
jgi:hypothetical protein